MKCGLLVLLKLLGTAFKLWNIAWRKLNLMAYIYVHARAHTEGLREIRRSLGQSQMWGPIPLWKPYKYMNIVSCMNGSQQGFRLNIAFTDHLRIVTTSNYDSLTELHTPSITVTTAHIKSSLHSLTFQLTSSQADRHFTPTSCSPLHSPTFNWALNLLLQTVPFITPWHVPHRKHCSSVAVQVLLIKDVLPSNKHCSIFISQLLPRNKCFRAIR
jgi:hypothetical protein